MARAQQGGAGAVTIWMSVFVALWLTSTVFLVVLYTGQEDLRRTHDEILARYRKTISASEERDIQQAREANERTTVVGLLEEERKQTTLLATGNEGDSAATVKSRRDDVIARIRSGGVVSEPREFTDISLLETATLLYQKYADNHALLQEAEAQVQELQDRVAILHQTNTDQKTAFENETRQWEEQLRSVEADRETFRQKHEEAVASLSQEFEAHRSENDGALADERVMRTSAEDKLAKLKERYDVLRRRFGDEQISPQALATARQPDGSILTAVPGDEVVYISLGRRDRLTLGMQFTVYSHETGIPADGRGKARIEVVSISESSAECKVARQFGNEVILEGDLIANPIYDRSRPLTFLVLGEFDLNHDGRLDPDGLDTVENLVTHWGGSLADDLTALTDFVVLGAPPMRPKAVGDASPEEAQRIEAARRIYERYTSTVAQARSLSIPVLPQNVFLHFLGYSGGLKKY